MHDENNYLPLKKDNLNIATKATPLFDSIREVWKSRGIIERSLNLLKVDPSSACQRIFNAAISDLREKLILMGVDIVKTATTIYKMEIVATEEDIKNYKVRGLIDLAHYTGLLTQVDRKRMQRSYDIRNDLEHEAMLYEANEADVLYIFQTCIEAVLSKDPINLIKVSEITKLIETTDRVYPDKMMIEDFKSTLIPRQEEIIKTLIGISLDLEKPDIVVENAFNTINAFSPYIHNDVKLNLTHHFSSKFRTLNNRSARIFFAAGLFPYISVAARKQYFDKIMESLKKVGPEWHKYPYHGEILRIFSEIGFLNYCPKDNLYPIIKWMIILYVGEPAYTSSFRRVYYSDIGASLVIEILCKSAKVVFPYKDELLADEDINKKINASFRVKERFDNLMDVIENKENIIF